METASLQGIIYTDYLKAVKVASTPSLLAKMGRGGTSKSIVTLRSARIE